MKRLGIAARILISLALLVGMYLYVSPRRAADALAGANWWPMAGALALMPVFVLLRMVKWLLLARQAVPGMRLAGMAPGYLWGMAVGMVTPGRVGEVARAWRQGATAPLVGLFVLEKLIEVGCLAALCLLAISLLGLSPYVALLATAVALAAMPFVLRAAGRMTAGALHRIFRQASADRLDKLRWALRNVRTSGCLVVSMLCFAVFLTQVWLVMRAMGSAPGWRAVAMFPIVMASNLIPITPGGLGLREAAAVLLLGGQAVPREVALNGFFLVTIADLLVPALLGVALHLFGKTSEAPRMATSGEAPAEAMEADQWDEFWLRRRRRPLGRLISWVRRRLISPALVKLVLRNTTGDTLIEAGCGTGEVVAEVAARRDLRVVLVDISPRALALARRNAERAGLDVRVVECDILHLSGHLDRVESGSTFNIGVVEHFSADDCAAILREMAAVSGESAFAVIPERSLFWRSFIALSRLGRLVPENFFIHLYRREELRELIERAGLEVLGFDRTRILGIIPYLGVRLRNAATP